MQRTVDTKFYTFNQNNSGGTFVKNDNIGHYVIIEAIDTKDAVRRAEDVGLYFEGCSTGHDCSCCGDRWNTPWGEDDGTVEPQIYSTVLSGDTYESSGYWSEEANTVVIHYYDGSKKVLPIVNIPWPK